MMKTIYLAGKVNGRKWKVVPKHPFVKYVASDGSNHSEHDWALSAWGKTLCEPKLQQAVEEQCLSVIEQSSAMFAYLDSPYSYGSIAEMATASILDIPVYAILTTWEEDDDKWGTGSMEDAYWFICNFPNVHAFVSYTEEHTATMFERILGIVLAESEVEKQLWNAFLSIPDVKLPVPQFEIDKYRLDFAWPAHHIAVEVDGHDYHKTKEQRSYDAKRDRDLLKLGWTTLRFTGSDVFRDADTVAAEVASILVQQAGA